MKEALATLTTRKVYIVPCFMEDGWFVRSAIPVALELPERQTVWSRNGQELRYCAPMGLHPGFPALLERRVASRYPGDPRTLSLLLVGHGSARAPGRPMALHRHAAALARTGGFRAVQAAFLEEPPFVADALRALHGSSVAVIGFFMGEGGHVTQDLPHLLAAERERRGPNGAPVLDLGAIGDEPGIAEFILDHVAAAAR